MFLVNDLMHPDILAGAEGFIFDCDGVLIDSLEANTLYYNYFRANFCLPPMNPEEEHFTRTHNTFDSFRHILPIDLYDEAMCLRLEFNYRVVMPYIRREPGVRSLLFWMRRHGFFLAVNTNRVDTMDLILEYTELTEFFRPVVTALTVCKTKPSPEGVFHILSNWHCPRERTVFIGDSVFDERTAKAAGVRFWSYRNENLDAEVFITDYFTLLRCLCKAYGLSRFNVGLAS